MESLSGARNLEAESIRSRSESTGGCVKLKTVTEIRRSSARDTFIADNVYLVYISAEHVPHSFMWYCRGINIFVSLLCGV